jgi:hypothetical protein
LPSALRAVVLFLFSHVASYCDSDDVDAMPCGEPRRRVHSSTNGDSRISGELNWGRGPQKQTDKQKIVLCHSRDGNPRREEKAREASNKRRPSRAVPGLSSASGALEAQAISGSGGQF